MKYDFDSVVERKSTYSSKWNFSSNILPMWVADMDFRTSPKIIEALKKRVEQGIYGYTDVSSDWKDAIISWWKRRHDFEMDTSWLLFSTGVIPSLSSLVRKLSNTGDNIAVITPVYDIFFHSIENNHRKVLECPLDYEDGVYSLDFDKLEGVLSTPNTPILILCNPHNPVGHIWSKDELKKISLLAKQYGTIVISDEIHCDIVRQGQEYAPYCSVLDDMSNSIMLISPTKAFNLAGIQTSAIVCPNKELFKKVYRTINDDEIAEPNIFAQIATISAYNESEDWLDELRSYLDENIKIVNEYIENNIEGVRLVKSYGTYLLWLDVSSICDDASKLRDFILEDAKLLLNEGNEYRGNGKSFLRMNIACPKKLLFEGLERLKKGIEDYMFKK